MSLTETPARPLRQDAARNQQRVLDAARAALGEYGTDATIELIAARAGVGVGTVYRRFPNKDALIDELIRQLLADLIAYGEQALARADGRGLEELLREVGRSLADHRTYAHLLVGRAPAEAGAERLRQLIAQLLEQALAHGTMGPDVCLGDIMTAIWAMRGVVETSEQVAPGTWQRHLDIHLVALRAGSELSRRPGVSAAQLAQISLSRA